LPILEKTFNKIKIGGHRKSEKFQALVINPRNINTNMESMDVSIDGQMIKTTDQMRLLGVDIDEKMNFSVHISEMCKKVSRKVGVLMCLRNMIPESAKLTIYKSSIYYLI
jgi:hypothetical protein